MLATVIAPRREGTNRKLPTRPQLRARMKALGWSKRELARRAGKWPSYVVRVFSGEYWPAKEVWPQLVEAVERGEAEQRKRA